MDTRIQCDGGVTAPAGFRASGVHAGIKCRHPDMALVVSDRPAAAAGCFTTNAVQAAPVHWDRERVAGGVARAVLFNSGNANACTGATGRRDVADMAARTAQALGFSAQEVLVCSTGVIGVPLPMDRVRAGIGLAVEALSAEGGAAAAQAILTTDTGDKQAALRLDVGGVPLTLGGMAKGAGMIEPNMATMLALVTTDAAVAPGDLHTALCAAVSQSFNRICVDGDQSTNDSVLILANGAAGGPRLDRRQAGWSGFQGALDELCLRLARKIVEDGEGATKYVTLHVRGAASDADAERVARAVARSALVKTSWFGADPNWGRVMAAAGYSGARVVADRVRIAYNGLAAWDAGTTAAPEVRARLVAMLREPRFEVSVDLGLGDGRATMYTCDLSLEYVRINADYTT